MLISPLGRVRNLNSSKQAGFTLVEVLVTMLIIGLMTGLVVLNLPKSDDPLKTEANLLAVRLQTAAQTSMINNQSIGIHFSKTGYRAVGFIGDEWETIERFEYHTEVPPVIELVQNGAKIDLDQARKSEFPVIRYDSTGLATPFDLTIDINGNEMYIKGSADGSVNLVKDEET